MDERKRGTAVQLRLDRVIEGTGNASVPALLSVGLSIFLGVFRKLSPAGLRAVASQSE